MAEFSRIIVPVDGSEGSSRAASFAAKLAGALGVPVTLAHVVPMTPESVMGLSQLDKSEVENVQRRRAATVLTEVRRAMGDAGDGVEEKVMVGDPAEEILHFVNADPDALVVMGRRGLSPVKTLMLGSVSEKVLRGAGSTVTLVK